MDHPNASRQTIHSKNGITPLLHIVLRHGPPLPVVDLLLAHYRDCNRSTTIQTTNGGETNNSSNNNSNKNEEHGHDSNTKDNNTNNNKKKGNTNKITVTTPSSSSPSSSPSSSSPPSSTPSSPPVSIWKQTDTNGRLPLHAACSCHPDGATFPHLDVIARIIDADPDATAVRTKNKDGRLPLHLAVVANAPECVVLELVIRHPGAAFLPDAHGIIPIEYARDSCCRHGHNRLVVALEMAPMLLKTARAAAERVEASQNAKLESLRAAHASYQQQLSQRCESDRDREQQNLLQERLTHRETLADEKERNIVLARALLREREASLPLLRETEELRDKNEELQQKLDRELLVRRARTKLRDEELKRILLAGGNNADTSTVTGTSTGTGTGASSSAASRNKNTGNTQERTTDASGSPGEKNKDESGNDDDDDATTTTTTINNSYQNDTEEEEENHGGALPSSPSLSSSFSFTLSSSFTKTPLPKLLKRISRGYESSKRRNRHYREQMDRQRETVRNLNLLLSAKEQELARVKRKARTDQRQQTQARTLSVASSNNRLDQLAVLHRSALAKLAKAEDEVDRLKRTDAERQRKLLHSERRLKIQEKRLAGVQILIASLTSINENHNANVTGTVNDNVNDNDNGNDNGNGNGVQTTTTVGEKEDRPSPTNNSGDVDHDVDVDVDDESKCGRGASSGTVTSFSTRRKEAELSAEIHEREAAAASTKARFDSSGGSGIDNLAKSLLARREEADLSAELAVGAAIADDSQVSDDDDDDDDDDDGVVILKEAEGKTDSEGDPAQMAPLPNAKTDAKVNVSEEVVSAEQQQQQQRQQSPPPMNKSESNRVPKGSKWAVAGGTPQTISIRTVTTAATSAEDGSGDGCSIEISIPRTPSPSPPVPEQVGGRSGHELDACYSPLATPKKLAFQ